MNEVFNHLWQSTLFAGGIALAAFALRRNAARTRYWLWLAASLKFLVPFSLLVSLGQQVELPATATLPFTATAVEQASETFAPVSAKRTLAPLPSAGAARFEWPAALAVVWGVGALILITLRTRQLLRLRTVMQNAAPLPLGLPLPAYASSISMEPGVVGIFRPALLLPEGIADRLAPEQLQSIMEHELCHVRHRDNLTAALHMAVETVFWFHPLVWWIGAKMVEERERACDESVLSAGSQPETYAESILHVCKLYLSSPLPCVSGVTGSDLKRRIREIMTCRVSIRLSTARKLMLAAAGLAAITVPVAIGVLRAQTLPPPPTYTYEVATIRPAEPGAMGTRIGPGPQGGMRWQNATVMQMLSFAYDVQEFQLADVPAWAKTDRFDISFTPDKAEITLGPGTARAEAEGYRDRQRQRTQALLRDRLGLVLRAETREMPVYALMVARGGHKLQEAQPGRGPHLQMTRGRLTANGVYLEMLVGNLSWTTQRVVVNETGLDGAFDFTLEWAPDAADETGPSIFTALTEQLGLRLESKRAPAPVFVVEKLEKPTEN